MFQCLISSTYKKYSPIQLADKYQNQRYLVRFLYESGAHAEKELVRRYDLDYREPEL